MVNDKSESYFNVMINFNYSLFSLVSIACFLVTEYFYMLEYRMLWHGTSENKNYMDHISTRLNHSIER